MGTGKEQHITITSSSNMSKEDIDKAVKEAERFAEEDKKRRESVDLKNEAENLCYAAEKLISENGDKIGNEDKDQINKKVADLIKAGTEDLQKTVYDISGKLYQQAAPQQGAPGQQAPGADPNASQPDGNVYDAEYKDVDDQNK